MLVSQTPEFNAYDPTKASQTLFYGGARTSLYMDELSVYFDLFYNTSGALKLFFFFFKVS